MFVGTAPFAVPSLRALVASGHDIALVVTQPDRPGHRLKLTRPAVGVAAEELRLPVFQPERIRRPDAAERVRAAQPDVVVVVAYGQIIPAEILVAAPRGVLNVHGSLLPAYRGAAPVAAAILAGDRVTGVTIMQMDEELDHGPILAAREVEIGPGEDAGGLTLRLAAAGADLLVDTLLRIDRVVPVPQDDALATYAPKLRREDGELEWSAGGEAIDRRVRAYTPWPGVTLPLGSRRLKVLRGRPLTTPGEPGRVLDVSGEGVTVGAGRDAYRLELIQAPGGRPLPAAALVAADA